MRAFRLALVIVVGFASTDLHAQIDPEELFGPKPVEIPLVGRPEHFSGASGSFVVEATTPSKQFNVGEPIVLTLIVRAKGVPHHPPERFPLEEVPELTRIFSVEPRRTPSTEWIAVASWVGLGSYAMAPLQLAALLGPKTSWTFEYVLRPRSAGKHEIPSLPFHFHEPRIPVAERSFQTQYTEPIGISVVVPPVAKIPIRAPQRFFELTESKSVLNRDRPWSPPSLALWILLAVLPPLGCGIWYLLWQRMYPDRARQARQRRSRAANLALRELAKNRHAGAGERAESVARTITRYLQHRVEMPLAEATPREAGYYLRRRGCSPELASRAASLYELCDRARFLPEAKLSEGLTTEASEFILAVEAET